MARQRDQQWVVAEQKDGSHEVWRGRRMVASGLQQQSSAVSLVEKNRREQERVWLADVDGYRTEITRRLRSAAPPVTTRRVPEAGPDRPVWNRYLARYGRPSRS